MSSSTQDHLLASSLKLVNFSEELCRSNVISKEVMDTFASLDHDRVKSGLKLRYLLQRASEEVKDDVTVFDQFLKVLARLRGGSKHLSMCLSKKLCELKRKPAMKMPDSSLRIEYRTIDTVVAEGKSTLLEVRVIPRECASYQWMKDGLSLSDTVGYSGACSDILVISHASHCTGGKYICHVSKGNEKVFSEDVLTVSLPPEKKQLLMLYSKDSEVPQDSWPPQVTSSFINLALIKKKKQDTDDCHYSVRGDMDDIRESKEEVSYEEVFSEYEHGGLVLVEGRPGSGKTTLVNKVSRDWAIKGDMLKNSKMVFLIPLRSLANRKAERLSDILELFYGDEEDDQELCEKVSGDIKRSQGEGVCFVIDGLDEYYPQDGSNSVIHQLLYKKTYLPAAMIIVASRPVATEKLRRKDSVTTRIEVLGFTRQQIFEYIKKYPFSSDILQSKLKAYLNSHLNILHMCYLPVHAAMICFLHEQEKGDIPPTETEIYEDFTRSIVLRKLTRSDEDTQLFPLEDLQGKDEEYFRKICQIAFEMTIHSKQVVLQKDTKKLSLGAGPNDAPSLGLVTIDRKAKRYGVDNTYTFLHLTFQEYLAALYLAKLEDDEQMEMIRVYAGEKHMQVMWKFYCGIAKFENKVAQIQEIMRAAQSSGYEGVSSGGENVSSGYEGVSLYGVQCAFESQQQVVCDSIVERTTGVLDLSGCTLTPSDMTALAYVISTTSHPVTKLAMSGCHLHDDHVGVFLREVSYNKLKCIQTLDLSRNNIGADGAIGLAAELKSYTNLQTLELNGNNIGSDGAIGLAKGLKPCTCLQTLWLNDNNIGADGAIGLAAGLKSFTNLQTLGLGDNNIGADGAIGLAEGLKSCTNLQTLWLRDNCIGADGAIGLAEGLRSCTNLQSLWLWDNNIGADGAIGLAEGLKSCTNLLTLGLEDNNIGTDGAIGLVEGLKSCTNLQTLGLGDNNIGADGAMGLAKVLKSYTNLQTLDLNDNNIGADGRAALAHLKCDIWH